MELRDDGALLESFASLSNSWSGLGTARDPLQNSEVNYSFRRLSQGSVEALFRTSRIIEKVICLLPEAASTNWVDWSFGSADVPASAMDGYLKKIGIRNAFQDASAIGRLYGDGYIILDVEDGQNWSEPVNEQAIASINGCIVRGSYDLYPDWALDGDYADPEFYRVIWRDAKKEKQFHQTGLSDQIHSSRILRFPGKRLFGEILRYTSGENDSCIQAMMDAFNAWAASMGASAAMLQDHSLFIYALNGLGKMIKAGETTELTQRFQAIQMGKSILKGLMLDAGSETASFVNRQYGGVDDITKALADRVVSESGMPPSKLWGASMSGSFSESGKSDRYEWAECVANFENAVYRPNLDILQRYVLLAKNGPTNGVLPEEHGYVFNSALKLTREETANLKHKNAQTDAINIRLGILTAEEVRQSRYGGAEYSDEITLIEDQNLEGGRIESQSQQQVEGNSNLEQLRADAAMGFIPRSHYLNAAGYDVEAIQSELLSEIEQDAPKRFSEPVDDETYNTDAVDKAWHQDECLRDARGRFAGGYCGGGRKGGGKGGGKKGGAKKFETSLAKKRREMKEARGGALAPSTIKQKARKAKIEALNKERNAIDDQLAANKRERDRNSGLPNSRGEERYRNSIRLGKEREQLEARRNELNRELQNTQSRVETFTAGRRLSDRQMNRALTQQDLEQAKSFPDATALNRMRVLQPDRYRNMQSVIQQYNQAREQNPGLTQQEFLSINSYTRGSGYIGQNAAARGLFNDPNSAIARQSITQARLTHQALGKLPEYQGTVRRDTALPANLANYEPGQRVRFDGVTSTTSDLSGRTTRNYGRTAALLPGESNRESNKALDYNRTAREMGIRTPTTGETQRVQYQMDVRSGRDISGFSVTRNAASEREVALRHGWTGRVTRVETLPDGTKKVYLEEE